MAKHLRNPTIGGDGVLRIAENRQARRRYEILDRYEAGIVLVGGEVKSVRGSGVNLSDSYVRLIGSELFLVGCHIKPYAYARPESYEPTRDRKLLLHRRELTKVAQAMVQQGLTAVPLQIYFRNGRCKLEIATCRGKKLHDRREEVKAREAQRDIDRALHSRRKG